MNTAATIAAYDAQPTSAPMRPRYDRRFRDGLAAGRKSRAGSRRARQLSEAVMNREQHSAAVRRLALGGAA